MSLISLVAYIIVKLLLIIIGLLVITFIGTFFVIDWANHYRYGKAFIMYLLVWIADISYVVYISHCKLWLG